MDDGGPTGGPDAGGEVLRYLEAIAPGSTPLDPLPEDDPVLQALTAREEPLALL